MPSKQQPYISEYARKCFISDARSAVSLMKILDVMTINSQNSLRPILRKSLCLQNKGLFQAEIEMANNFQI